MYFLRSTLCDYYLLLFVILFIALYLYVSPVQYVVSLLLAANFYVIYNYIDICIFCTIRCVV